MLYTVGVFVILFFILDGRTLFINKEFKELAIASVLLLIAFSYGLDITMEWNQMPNPNALFYKLKPVADAFNAYFQANS